MTKCPRRFLGLLVVLSMGFAGLTTHAADSAGRERLLLDFGWRFHLGNDWGPGYGLAKAGTGYGPGSAEYSDASWRKVDLPHDWVIELPFDKTADGSHGFKAIGEGFPQNSTGWYRRTFDLPASDAGKRLWLEFDGVYRDCTVIVNGWFVGHHEGGYNGFRYDITDVANCGGRNVVTVRVDASQFEGWFYEGAGIYRHVWLVKTAPLSVAPDGVFVFSTFKGGAAKGPAEIHIQTRLANTRGAAADASVAWEVLSPSGESLAKVTGSQSIGPKSRADLEQTALVESPRLWSPESPSLYRLVTTVSSGGKVVDRVETTFGIRTFAFDADRGFLLNGEPYTLKGTSNHQDHAGVGSALPDGVQYYRIARLKDMGCNAYRSSHNPPTPELLDACDRLGMIVMDENRLLGSDSLHLAMLEQHIKRDRNHACVGLWSLGNEEFTVQGTQSGRRTVATMQELVKRLDPSRPVTCNAAVGNEYPGVNEAIEVRGWSYHVGPDMDAYHKEHPLQPNVGSEQGSTVSTRGIYANDPVRGYVSAYDDNAPEWAQTAETWLTYFATRPWMSGGFVWTGFDYRGEPTPYGWPCISSHFGILDTCGFAKDNFWFYQAAWTDSPMVHVLPHWNWPGREGQEIDVRTQSNCDEVELFLNGQSLGRQAVKRNSESRWKVVYEPGALTARAFRADRVVAEAKVETTAAAAAVQLKADKPAFWANREDVSLFTVSVVDAQGRVVPVAGNGVAFEVEGPGRIIGVGNGDPSCHEPDTLVAVAPSHTLPIDGWRMKKVSQSNQEMAPEEAVGFDDSAWDPVDVRADVGALGLRERAFYRTRFKVEAKDLASPAVEVVFSRIAGGVGVYVNGHRVGGGVDGHWAAVYDVKALLHPGENVIAVPVENYGPEGAGISKGVVLRLTEDPPALHWSRSVFNGLAQVIVQSTGEPGGVTLKATSEGLQPASLEVKAMPASPRPSVP
jgi:beta-galactosidase